jgi:hypothetical protein
MIKGYDLLDVNDPGSDFSLRKLWLFFDRLPTKNEITRELLGMDKSEFEHMWDMTNAQLADLYDAISYNTFALVKMNSDKHSTVPQPKPYPRPKYGKQETVKDGPRRGPQGSGGPEAPKVNPLKAMPVMVVKKE